MKNINPNKYYIYAQDCPKLNKEDIPKDLKVKL